MSKGDKQASFVERVRTALDDSTDRLDRHTQTALRAARLRALHPERAALRARWWMPASGVALASAVLVAVLLSHTNQPVAPRMLPGTDIELLTSAHSLEFYNDLDFYQWLQETESDAG